MKNFNIDNFLTLLEYYSEVECNNESVDLFEFSKNQIQLSFDCVGITKTKLSGEPALLNIFPNYDHVIQVIRYIDDINLHHKEASLTKETEQNKNLRRKIIYSGNEIREFIHCFLRWTCECISSDVGYLKNLSNSDYRILNNICFKLVLDYDISLECGVHFKTLFDNRFPLLHDLLQGNRKNEKTVNNLTISSLIHNPLIKNELDDFLWCKNNLKMTCFTPPTQDILKKLYDVSKNIEFKSIPLNNFAKYLRIFSSKPDLSLLENIVSDTKGDALQHVILHHYLSNHSGFEYNSVAVEEVKHLAEIAQQHNPEILNYDFIPEITSYLLDKKQGNILNDAQSNAASRGVLFGLFNNTLSKQNQSNLSLIFRGDYESIDIHTPFIDIPRKKKIYKDFIVYGHLNIFYGPLNTYFNLNKERLEAVLLNKIKKLSTNDIVIFIQLSMILLTYSQHNIYSVINKRRVFEEQLEECIPENHVINLGIFLDKDLITKLINDVNVFNTANDLKRLLNIPASLTKEVFLYNDELVDNIKDIIIKHEKEDIVLECCL